MADRRSPPLSLKSSWHPIGRPCPCPPGLSEWTPNHPGRESSSLGRLRQRVLATWSLGSGALIIAAVAASATFVAYRQTGGQPAKGEAARLSGCGGLRRGGGRWARAPLRPRALSRLSCSTSSLSLGRPSSWLLASLAPRPRRRKSLISSSSSAKSGPARCAMLWPASWGTQACRSPIGSRPATPMSTRRGGPSTYQSRHSDARLRQSSVMAG